MVKRTDLKPSLAVVRKQMSRQATKTDTRPHGVKVISEGDSLQATDPLTGKTTIIDDGGLNEWVGDTTIPPVPAPLALATGNGFVTATWKGDWAVAGSVMPLDFDRLDVLSNGTYRGSIQRPGDSVTWPGVVDEVHNVVSCAVDMAGNTSAFSTASTITILPRVDIAPIQADLTQAETDIANAQATLNQVTGAAPMPLSIGQAIANGSQHLLSLAVTQLAVGTGSMAVGVIDKMYSEIVLSRKILSNQVIIGAGANMIPWDPTQVSPHSTWNGSTITPVKDADVGQCLHVTLPSLLGVTWATSFKFGTGSKARSGRAESFDVEVNEAYRVNVGISLGGTYPGGSPQVRLFAQYRDMAGNVLSSVNGTAIIPSYSGTPTYASLDLTVPAGTICVDLYVQQNAVGLIMVHNPEMLRVADGTLVATNSITAPKIVASEELTAKIAQFLFLKANQIDVNELWADTAWITKANAQVLSLLSNTDGTGTTTEHTAYGMRTFYTDPETGEQQDRISLGNWPGNPNYFGLTDDAGQLSVSIDKEGEVAGRVISARDRLEVDGEDVMARFNEQPRPLVAWGQVPINSNMSSNGEVGLFEIGWETNDSPDRMYEFNLNPFLVSVTAANGVVGLRLRYTTDGTAPTINSTLLGFYYATPVQLGSTITLAMNRIIGSSNGPYIRLLVSLFDSSTGVAEVYTGLGQTHLFCTVRDLGPAPGHSASATSGGGTPYTGSPVSSPAVPKVTKTQTWYYNSVRSFLGNNAHYIHNPSKGYQGQQPYTSNGNLKSIWTFPSLTSTLSGATINWVEAYFYFEHWYANAGGTARIRMHGNSTQPGTYNGTGFGTNVGGWARGTGRWVRLPSSLHAGFLSGAYKGLALEGDGTFNTYGIANDARIRINYTK